MTGKPMWQMKKLIIFLTHYLFSFSPLFCSHLVLFAGIGSIFSLACYWYQKKAYCNNPVLWHYWDIWILRPFMGLLSLPFLLCYPSQSDLFSGSGCMWKTLTALQCGAQPKLVDRINLVDHVFSHKNIPASMNRWLET